MLEYGAPPDRFYIFPPNLPESRQGTKHAEEGVCHGRRGSERRQRWGARLSEPKAEGTVKKRWKKSTRHRRSPPIFGAWYSWHSSFVITLRGISAWECVYQVVSTGDA